MSLRDVYVQCVSTAIFTITFSCFFITFSWAGDYSTSGPINVEKSLQSDSKSHIIPSDNFELCDPAKNVNDLLMKSQNNIVLHVQDVEGKYEVKTNSIEVFNDLVSKYRDHTFRLVNLKARKKFVGPDELSVIPHRKIRKEIAQQFLIEGHLTPSEYFSVIGSQLFPFFTDDSFSYAKHINTLQNDSEMFFRARNYFNQLDKALGQIRNEVYSPELTILTELEKGFSSWRIDTGDYIRKLRKIALRHGINLAGYYHFNSLSTVHEMECSIDMKRLETERLELIDHLLRTVEKRKSSMLLTKSLYYRLQKIDPLEYYHYLESLLISQGDTLDHYPGLGVYLAVLKRFKEISVSRALVESEEIIGSIKEKILRDNDQKITDQLHGDIAILKGLFHAMLLRDDIQYLVINQNNVNVATVVKTMKYIAEKNGIDINLGNDILMLENLLPQAYTYYNAVNSAKGNGSSVELLHSLKMYPEKTAIIISSGKNQCRLVSELDEKKIPFLIVSPKIAQFRLKAPYETVSVEKDSILDGLVRIPDMA